MTLSDIEKLYLEKYQALKAALDAEITAKIRLDEKYAAFQAEMIAHKNGNYEDTKLELLRTANGKDLHDLWRAADMDLSRKAAERVLLQADLFWCITWAGVARTAGVE